MADTDLLTLDEAMSAISMVGSGANHAETLSIWITAVSEIIDDRCGPVVIRTITDEIHYAKGATFLLPIYTPVDSITTVTEYVSGTGTVLTAEDFDTQGTYLWQDGLLYRRSSWDGTTFSGTVKLTYEAGRYDSTEEVGAKWKLAAGACLRRLWAREAPAWARGGSVYASEETGGVGFFRVIEPVLEEMLADEINPPAVA